MIKSGKTEKSYGANFEAPEVAVYQRTGHIKWWCDQRWALPQIGPQIRKLRTQVSICGFANLISYRKYLRICGEKLKFTANPQTNRQSCLIRGKTARKKWMLLFSGLEVDDRELMTFFFFFFWRSASGRWQNLTLKNKKGHHEDKITVNIAV